MDGAIVSALTLGYGGRSVPRGEAMKSNIGMTDKDRDGVVKALTALLADEYMLYTKTRNYHWNGGGTPFQRSPQVL